MFFEELKKARADAGMTQQALHELTHIPKRTIEDWETGKYEPPGYVQRFLLNELKSMKKTSEKNQKN